MNELELRLQLIDRCRLFMISLVEMSGEILKALSNTTKEREKVLLGALLEEVNGDIKKNRERVSRLLTLGDGGISEVTIPGKLN